MMEPEARSEGWVSVACEAWRSDIIRCVSGLQAEQYMPSHPAHRALVPPTYLLSQHLKAADLGVPDAPVHLNGGNSTSWFVEVFDGDLLIRASRVKSVEEKVGRSGRLLIHEIESTFRRVSDGRLAAKTTNVAIRRHPHADGWQGTSVGPRPLQETEQSKELGELVRRVCPTPRDLVRFAAAANDFYELHYDRGAAERAGLRNVIVHGALKSGFLAAAALEFIGGGFVTEVSARYLGSDFVSEPLDLYCQEVSRHDRSVQIETVGRSSSGVWTTAGEVTVRTH